MSFVVLMPLLQVIFGEDKEKVLVKPVYKGFTSGGEYLNEYFSYYVSSKIGEDQEKNIAVL